MPSPWTICHVLNEWEYGHDLQPEDTGDDLKGHCKAEQTWYTTTVLFQTAIIVSAMHLTFTINHYRIPYIRLWSIRHIIIIYNLFQSFSVRINLWVSLAVGWQLPAFFCCSLVANHSACLEHGKLKKKYAVLCTYCIFESQVSKFS